MSQTIQLVWKGDFRFDATGRGGSITSIDGNSTAGTAPVDLLLESVGACAAIDVVDILKKSRQEVLGMAVEVEAKRSVPWIYRWRNTAASFTRSVWTSVWT